MPADLTTPAALPRVDAVVLAWLAEPLRASVSSLLASEKVDVHVYLVDNGCTTDDVEFLSTVPGVTVLRPGENLGFSGGVNLGAAAGDREYIMLLNADAVVEPGTLARLIEELDRPDVGIAAGSVRLAEDPAKLNSNGNVVHVLGLSWVGGFGERETRTAPTDSPGAMGACVVLRRRHWEHLGGFYDAYFAYHEDAEISIRTWQQGLRVVSVPDAICVHEYEFSRNPNKLYLVERNRLMFVLTLWSWRALVLLAPPMLALEAGMVLLAWRQGFLSSKLRGYRWLWGHRRQLRARRRFVRSSITVPDRRWMRILSDQMDTPLVEIPKVVRTPLNIAMRAYWWVVRPLV